MKRAIRTAGILAGLGAVVWLMRDRLLRVPDGGDTPSAGFRVSPTNGEGVPISDDTGIKDDLTEIVGVGPVYSRRLAQQGISRFAELAEADAADLAERLDLSTGQVAKWISQASDLA